VTAVSETATVEAYSSMAGEIAPVVSPGMAARVGRRGHRWREETVGD